MTATPSPERLDMLRLALSEGVGPINFRKLMTDYGAATAAVAALPERMKRAGRRDAPRIPSRSEVEQEWERTLQMGARIVLLGDPDYPTMLSHIPDSPPALWIWGDADLLSSRAVGVVGARNASAAGIRIAESLSAELAHADITVVSGLARGIDAAAHHAALHRKRTVAAVAGGLDKIYPSENERLYREIVERGCIVTEAPLGTVPQSRHFPRRNRLIAGLSLGSLVIEAALRSGTLITARLAHQYQREVYAVPGSPLDPRSRGSNDLIRQHAILTETIEDILLHLPDFLPPPALVPWRGPEGFSEPSAGWSKAFEASPAVMKSVRSLLSPAPIPVDDIVRRCQFSVSAVTSALSELELGGVATFLPGGLVALLPDTNM